MQVFKTALKEAGWVFLLSRLIILLVSYIAVSFLPQFVFFRVYNTHFLDCTHGIQPDPCFYAWFHWDAVAYARVGYQGYASTLDAAFFPLWPLAIHIGGVLLGGTYPFSYYLSGVLLANLFFYAALVLLYCLLAGDFEESLARRALFYLAFYPYALFFFLGYSESLFLLLCLGVFLLLRRGRTLDWWLAGGLGFLATLTRSAGVLLAIPFLVMYVQRFWLADKRGQAEEEDAHSAPTGWKGILQKAGALVPVLLIPAGLLVYMFYLWRVKGNPLIFQVEEATFWRRHLDFFGISLLQAMQAALGAPSFSYVSILNLLDVLFIALPITALALGWRRLPLHYSLFALASMLFSLSFPTAGFNPDAAQPRFLMLAFPIFIVFAQWGKRSRFDQAYVAFALPLLALFVTLFIVHFWVA